MSKFEDQVSEKLHHIIEDRIPVRGQMAKVVDVDPDHMECTVQLVANDMKIHFVNLKAQTGTENQNGFIQIPKKGSIVLISLIEISKYERFSSGDYYISMYSELDGIRFIQNNKDILNIDNTGNFLYQDQDKQNILKMANDGQITFHKGENKGLVKIDVLKKELEKNTKAIEKIINVLTSWKVVANDGGGALLTQAGQELAPLQLGDFSNIENDKITH